MTKDSIRKLFDSMGLNFVSMIDYNSNYYIVHATREDNNTDPFYSVNKKTNAVAHFSPASDWSIIQKFKEVEGIE